MTGDLTIETPRLFLRPIAADDFEPFYARLVCDNAVMDTPNVASRRAAEKLGFTYRGQVTVYGSDEMVLYTLAREAASGVGT